jgi:hypothetical protein
MLQSILVGQPGVRGRRHRVHVAVIKVVGERVVMRDCTTGAAAYMYRILSRKQACVDAASLAAWLHSSLHVTCCA